MTDINRKDYVYCKTFRNSLRSIVRPGDDIEDKVDSSTLKDYERNGMIVQRDQFADTPEGVAYEANKGLHESRKKEENEEFLKQASKEAEAKAVEAEKNAEAVKKSADDAKAKADKANAKDKPNAVKEAEQLAAAAQEAVKVAEEARAAADEAKAKLK